MTAMGQSATSAESLRRVRFRFEFGIGMADTFLWTSLANEACVVEAERLTNL
jgi:hypothetical protein